MRRMTWIGRLFTPGAAVRCGNDVTRIVTARGCCRFRYPTPDTRPYAIPFRIAWITRSANRSTSSGVV